MRQTTWAKCFGAALLLIFTAAALAWPPPTAAQSNVPPPSEMHPGVTILTPHPGVDFDSYINRLLPTVKRNWYAVMPQSALNGEKGIVVLTFHIQQDGKIPVPDPSLERSSGSKELDIAAMAAVRISAPFDPLPEAFHGPNIKLRFIYFYNLPVDLFKATTTPSDSQSDPRTNLLAPLRSPLHLPPPAAAQSTNSAPAAARLTVEITNSPTKEADFRAYSVELSARVKRNWFAMIPEGALTGEKGTVTVGFHIQQDGTLLAGEPKLESGSGKEALDNAALEAIRKSVPFDHLPAAYHDSNIKLRCTFDYLGAGESQRSHQHDPNPDGTPRTMPLAQPEP
jgi:TonB family protein